MTHTATAAIVSPQDFLTHWQGHRALTRRVIEAFPEDQLFTFSAAPPMRTFGELVNEIHMITEYVVSGLITNEWPAPSAGDDSEFPTDRPTLLAAWDRLTERMNRELPTVPVERYAEHKDLAWGGKTVLGWVVYAIDNEIHHRAQGYVYLRALGIEPPAFYER